jgi:SpoVK/Ycf46/Vps4 family AAA+-type ATPase
VLDYALWRRFDDVIEVPSPAIDELVRVLQAELRGSLAPETIRRAAEQLDGLPHAAAERVARDTLRAALLDNSPRVTPEHLHQAVSRALSRPWT